MPVRIEVFGSFAKNTTGSFLCAKGASQICQLCFSPTNSSSGPPSDTPFPTMAGAACFFSTRRAVVEAEWVHDDQRGDSFQSKV